MEILNAFTDANTEMKNSALDYINKINKINAIERGCDGYISDGQTTTFSLSGKSDGVHPTSPATVTDTLLELGVDYEYITNAVTYYSEVYNGDLNLGCYTEGNLCVSPTMSLAESFSLTKEGRFPSTTTSASQPSTVQFELAPNQSQILSADKTDVLVFGHIAINKSILDANVTGNLKYFKDNYKPYINNDNSLWTGLREALEYTQDPMWLELIIKEFADAIANNEDYFLGQMVTAKQQLTQRFAPEGQTKIVEGLSVAGDSTSTVEVKTDKERKLYYEKVDDASYQEIVRRVNDTTNEDNSNFNLKFN